MKYKAVQKVVFAHKINMSGLVLDQALPAPGLESADPFLLIHHAEVQIAAGSHVRDYGVGPHPHRGFSPVTFVYQGDVHHRDSRGNSRVVHAGGTQWMHSGMGLIHSERPSATLASVGGVMEIVQFWVNVPERYKMSQPYYLPLEQDDTPTWHAENDNAVVQVITGKFKDLQGPVKTYTPMLILRIALQEGGTLQVDVPPEFETLLYQLDGQTIINEDLGGASKQLTWFDRTGRGIQLHAHQPTRAILFAGAPIGEKIVVNGPFVMNSETQILEAMRDYQMGKMGFLVEDFND